MIKLPSGLDINNLIDDLRIISWEASEVLLYYSKILKHSQTISNILKNNDQDNPVTIADLKVNELVIKKIKDKYRNVNWKILSEENVKLCSHNYDIDADWVWVLDPLDGTKDFIQGTSDFAMHLALNYKKKPFLGIVLIPEKNELWISYANEVWCERKDGSRAKPALSKFERLKDMTLVTSKNHGNETLQKLIKLINFKEVKTMGSIGCKIASIVKGECDMYICLSLPMRSSPRDWDFAAPEAILKAAGGQITTLDNEELSYCNLNFEQRGIIIASNNLNTHQMLCFEIKEIIESNKLYPL